MNWGSWKSERNAAISRGARDGILVKGGVYLKALAGIRVIAFDKKGTLTRADPS